MTSAITCKSANYSIATKENMNSLDYMAVRQKTTVNLLKGYYQYDSDHETLLALPYTRT